MPFNVLMRAFITSVVDAGQGQAMRCWLQCEGLFDLVIMARKKQAWSTCSRHGLGLVSRGRSQCSGW